MKTIKKINLILIVASYFVVGLGDCVYPMRNDYVLPIVITCKIENYWRASINYIDRMSFNCARGYFVDESTVHATDSVKTEMLQALDMMAVDCMIECIEMLKHEYNARRITGNLYEYESIVIEKIAALHYMQTNPSYRGKLYIIRRLVLGKCYYLKQHFTGNISHSKWPEKRCKQQLLIYLTRFPLLSDKQKNVHIDAFDKSLQGCLEEQTHEPYITENEAAYKERLKQTSYQEPSYQLLMKYKLVLVSQEQQNSALADDLQRLFI